jgi:CDP-diacylglycerol--serine O-phosphatidyltransferase
LRNRITIAFGLLLVTVLLDHLDGFLARSYYGSDRSRRSFGKQLDNFADFQNFAILPSALFLQIFPDDFLAWLAAVSLNTSAAFRLSRIETNEVQDGILYDGLPTTFSAFILLNVFVLYQANVFSSIWPILFAVMLALLQIAHFPVRKPRLAWMMTIYASSLTLTCAIVYVAKPLR